MGYDAATHEVYAGFSQQTMWISPVNMMTLSMNNGKLV